MTDRWFVSKDAMKGFDLLSVCTNALFALEQMETEERMLSKKEIHESLEKGQVLLKKLRVAAESQINRDIEADARIFRLVDDLRGELRITSSQLIDKILRAEGELEKASASDETIKLLEKLCLIAKGITEKGIVALSSSIH
jgi:hypothetical protein